jgi:hypothetical protein
MSAEHMAKRLTRWGQTLSCTVLWSILSEYSGSPSSNAILVPLSGLVYSLTTGSSTNLPYSFSGTSFPKDSTSGSMAELGAVGRESECNSEGKTLYSKNGWGIELDESWIVRSRDNLSPSDRSSKPSSPSTRVARGFCAQNPVVVASATKLVVGRRVRGLGLTILFHSGKRDFGMAPAKLGVGCDDRFGNGD